MIDFVIPAQFEGLSESINWQAFRKQEYFDCFDDGIRIFVMIGRNPLMKAVFSPIREERCLLGIL